MKANGLTLLEVLVALAILGLVGLGLLELFGGTLRAAETSQVWSQGLVYATDAMETLKLSREPLHSSSPEQLAGGFQRWVEVRPWTERVARVTVVVALAGGGRVTLDRLMELRQRDGPSVAPSDEVRPQDDF
jgi:prepilin-type N-terminal cleavage/methylation domain-containing protein